MLKNDRYDEAVEVSQSLDQMNIAAAMKNAGVGGPSAKADYKGGNDAKSSSNNINPNSEAKGLLRTNTEQTRSQSVLNKPFDEALEFSHSGSDESIDTARDRANAKSAAVAAANNSLRASSNDQSTASNPPQRTQQHPQSLPPQQQQQRKPVYEVIIFYFFVIVRLTLLIYRQSPKKSEEEGGESGSEEENEHEESYEHIEGAYNPRDYQNLNVPAEVRDLFQYIERYKPQEVELDTPLKCFIPEFIPAIGELDPFIKVLSDLSTNRSFFT